MPLCRPLGDGIWEQRTSLPGNREARLLFGFLAGHFVVVHGFFKRTRTTPKHDLDIARKRLREMEA